MCPKSLKNYRDEEKALAYRNRQRRENYRKCVGRPEVSGTEWSTEDELLVLEHSVSDRELSKQIGRSVRAIQKKRYLLKKRMAIKDEQQRLEEDKRAGNILLKDDGKDQ